jgi:hypothetical protein
MAVAEVRTLGHRTTATHADLGPGRGPLDLGITRSHSPFSFVVPMKEPVELRVVPTKEEIEDLLILEEESDSGNVNRGIEGDRNRNHLPC